MKTAFTSESDELNTKNNRNKVFSLSDKLRLWERRKLKSSCFEVNTWFSMNIYIYIYIYEKQCKHPYVYDIFPNSVQQKDPEAGTSQ